MKFIDSENLKIYVQYQKVHKYILWVRYMKILTYARAHFDYVTEISRDTRTLHAHFLDQEQSS